MNAPARALVSDVSPVSAGRASRRDHAVAGALLGVAVAYATLRYNLFKGVPWSDWPGYVANKALAVAGVWLLAWAAWRKLNGAGSTRVPMAWAGCLIVSHALVSFGLFNPTYFSKFFAEGRVNGVGGLALLTGAGAVALLELGARGAPDWSRRAWLRSLAVLLVFSVLHTSLPGLGGWFAPATWPGRLPPLTLLASAPALLAVVALARANWKTHPTDLT